MIRRDDEPALEESLIMKAEREDKERKARYQERQDNDARRASAETGRGSLLRKQRCGARGGGAGSSHSKKRARNKPCHDFFDAESFAVSLPRA